MNGKEKVMAAFSEGGAKDIPALICYEGIVIRDHWNEMFSWPWWYQFAPELEKQAEWRVKAVRTLDVDWFQVKSFYTRTERENMFIDVRGKGVFLCDRQKGEEKELVEPQIGGDTVLETEPDIDIDDFEAVKKIIPERHPFDPDSFIKEGVNDLAGQIIKELDSEACPVNHISSPLGRCFRTVGFQNFMMLTAMHPEFVKELCKMYFERITIHQIREAAALGANIVWLAESFTDMISPDTYREINLPVLRRVIEEIRSNGMKTVFYYCGDPRGKMDYIMDSGADALAFEEGKKTFSNNIEELAERISGQCTLLGNLDAYGVLEKGSEQELRDEIKRQITAGRKNSSRFMMSVGSPVTPDTSIDRVRLYCEMVHELGKGL